MSYFFDVPENPGDPQGRKIKVFAHTHERPRELPTDQDNPVVFFNGGPGASRESSFSSLRRQQQMGKFWGKKVSFIFLDKRGNGCSTAYLSGDDAETLGRLVHWGSRGTVSDAEHVRKAMLGDRKWRIFGQSYGTFIAHRYLQVAGEGMDSAHAHANALNADPLRRLSNRLRSQHRVLEAFLAAYPSAREPLRLLRDCLGPEDCFEVGAQNSEGKPVQSCGRALLVKMNSFLGFSKNWPILHMWIQAMEGPDGLDHVAIRDFARYFFDPSPQPYAATWEVLSHVDCNTGAWNRETCQAALDLAQADCEDPTSWLIHEYQWTLQKPRDEEFEQRYQALLERVAKLPRDHLTIDQLREALLRHPSVPFYL